MWCTFYQKHVQPDDVPDDIDCKAPESLTKDVISCQDCECFSQVKIPARENDRGVIYK